MQALATSKGGICLSKAYKDANSKLEWRCNNNHIWRATPSSVKNLRTWCPFCSGLKKVGFSQTEKELCGKIESLYNERLTGHQIALRLGITSRMVYSKLKKLRITRTNSEAQKIHALIYGGTTKGLPKTEEQKKKIAATLRRKYIEGLKVWNNKFVGRENEFYDFYHNQKKDVETIADHFGIDRGTIWKWAKRLKITRSISEGQKNRYQNGDIPWFLKEENKEKHKDAIKKATVTKKRKYQTGELVPWNKDKKMNSEYRQKVSIATKEAMQKPEIKEKLSIATKRYFSNPEMRKIQSERRRKYDREHVGLVKERGKKIQMWWSEHPDAKAAQGERVIGLMEKGALPKLVNTKPEARLKEQLLGAGCREAKKGYSVDNFDFVHQYHLGKYLTDFAFERARVIVEVDGFGHDLKQMLSLVGTVWYPTKRHVFRKLEHDREREKFLKQAGWKIIRFTARQIRMEPEKCISGIFKEIRNKSDITGNGLRKKSIHE